MTKGKLITTLPILEKSYFVSFEMKPTSLPGGYHNILHFTIGGDIGKYGERTPAVWSNGNSLHVCSAVSGNANYCQDIHNFIKINEWFSLNISQQLTNGKYMYKIETNGTVFHEVENKEPATFDNVEVYVSNPWYPANPGSIRKIIVGTGTDIDIDTGT